MDLPILESLVNEGFEVLSSVYYNFSEEPNFEVPKIVERNIYSGISGIFGGITTGMILKKFKKEITLKSRLVYAGAFTLGMNAIYSLHPSSEIDFFDGGSLGLFFGAYVGLKLGETIDRGINNLHDRVMDGLRKKYGIDEENK